MAIVVLALIHGQLDYTKAITTAVMCGIDTDCNGGTVGSIVGAAVGYAGLDQRWISPLNDRVKTVVANFGEGSISDLVRRTIQVWRKTDDGGMKT
jgi:ADP-ribosylglycohydrolase